MSTIEDELTAAGFGKTLAGRWWRASDGALVQVDGDKLLLWNAGEHAFVPWSLDGSHDTQGRLW